MTRRAAPRWTAEQWAEADPVLQRRARSKCEHCGRPLRGRCERHHRQRRRVGGDRFANLLVVLPECHSAIHRHVNISRINGWVVSAYTPEPADVPVLIGEHWFTLDDQGSRTPVP